MRFSSGKAAWQFPPPKRPSLLPHLPGTPPTPHTPHHTVYPSLTPFAATPHLLLLDQRGALLHLAAQLLHHNLLLPRL